MELALKELPLILFTTLGPIGAGAFVPLFIMYLCSIYHKTSTSRIDQLTLVPVLCAFIGFLCSFFHLANPSNGLNIFLTAGRTPLANEVIAFSVFLVLALVYWMIVSMKKHVSTEVRMFMTGIVMVAGLVAVVFMGMVYLIPALPAWDAPRTIVEMLGIWLFGGVALGMFLIALADPRDNNAHADELISKVIFGLGGVVLLGASVSIFMVGSSMDSAIIDVAQNSNSLLFAQNLAQIFIILAIVSVFFGRNQFARPVLGIVCGLSFIACFLVRLCFYGMQIGIGL